MKKTVIINRGIPASGKSSFAKEIVATFEQNGLCALRCSTDSFFMVEGEYKFDVSKLREYHIKNQQRFKNALKDACNLVICDNTNIEPWEANVYYELAKEHGYDVILMDFEARELDSHVDAQSNEDYRHYIPSDVLELMLEKYQNYKELTDKHSYPKSYHIKREYNETTRRVETTEDISEPFYYDSLIKVSAKEYLQMKEIIGMMILKKIREHTLDEIQLIPEHYKIIMRAFHKKADKTLTAYELKDSLGKTPKQIERYFDTLKEEFFSILEIKVGRRNGYKLIDNFDIFIETFEKFDNEKERMDDLLEILKESEPALFKKLEYKTSKKSQVYLFKNAILEKVDNQDIFNELKKAIKLNEYRNIIFKEGKVYENIKPIKLVFIDNNWYIAYVDEEDILRLGRVSFLEKITYSKKNSYQKNSIRSHLNKLKIDLQNSMTLFDRDPQTATLKATGQIAKYFKEPMKKFLSSQKFIKEEEDGSVIFTVQYTQELEILPFVQKWMPDLIILEPQELRDAYKEKLQKALNTY